MSVTAQRSGVFVSLDDASYLADLLAHLCATTRPSPQLSRLARLLRVSCDSLTPAQGKHLRGLESQCDAGQAAAYDLVDVKEAAGILGCSPANVRDLIARGRLAGHRAGRNWLLPARVVVERAERRAARHAG